MLTFQRTPGLLVRGEEEMISLLMKAELIPGSERVFYSPRDTNYDK